MSLQSLINEYEDRNTPTIEFWAGLSMAHGKIGEVCWETLFKNTRHVVAAFLARNWHSSHWTVAGLSSGEGNTDLKYDSDAYYHFCLENLSGSFDGDSASEECDLELPEHLQSHEDDVKSLLQLHKADYIAHQEVRESLRMFDVPAFVSTIIEKLKLLKEDTNLTEVEKGLWALPARFDDEKRIRVFLDFTAECCAGHHYLKNHVSKTKERVLLLRTHPYKHKPIVPDESLAELIKITGALLKYILTQDISINDDTPTQTLLSTVAGLPIMREWEAKQLELITALLQSKTCVDMVCVVELAEVLEVNCIENCLVPAKPLRAIVEEKWSVNRVLDSQEQNRNTKTATVMTSNSSNKAKPQFLSPEETTIYFWTEYKDKKDKEQGTLCIGTSYRRELRKHAARFAPNSLEKKLLEIILAVNSPGVGITVGTLLKDIYGFDLMEEAQKYKAKYEEKSNPSSSALTGKELFSRVLQPEIKKLQSLIKSVRDKFSKAKINPDILPKISTGFSQLTTKVCLIVDKAVDHDLRREDAINCIPKKRLQPLHKAKNDTNDLEEMDNSGEDFFQEKDIIPEYESSVSMYENDIDEDAIL